MIKECEMHTSHSIKYGKEIIPFALKFHPRKRLSISVYPDRSVKVSAPKSSALSDVLGRIQKRASWIAKQRTHFEQYHPLPKEKRFISGETHFYLGRQYRLKLHKDRESNVRLLGKFLHVHTKNTESKRVVSDLLDDWYEIRAKIIFETRLCRWLKKSPFRQLPQPKLFIRRMLKRWGSCTKTRNILLNLDLIKVPINCIEYVLMHELCHLLIHNHSADFYRLLTQCMPDWKKRKARLDTYIL